MSEDPECESCGTKEGIYLGPCPYASEIHNDHRDVWLCNNCSEERLMDT